jgi:chemotaxis protein histidine kinase CheA
VQGISGGAILGDGKVGLILDMAGLWQLTHQGDGFLMQAQSGLAGRAD